MITPFAFANSIQHNTESWNIAQFIGNFSQDKKVKYFIQPFISFIDRENKFHTASLFLGVGYQLNDDLLVWLMNGETATIQGNGNELNINTIRQELDWHTWRTNPNNFYDTAFASITRLEERKNQAPGAWQIRFRQKGIFRTPIKGWQGHSFVTSDEIFLDFTHPQWINSNSFLQQNQAFIGMGTVVSRNIAFDFGYLNQYLWNNTKHMNSIASLIVYVNID